MTTIRLQTRDEGGLRAWMEVRVDHVAAVEPHYVGGSLQNHQQVSVPEESILTLCTGRVAIVTGFRTEALVARLKQLGW